MASIEDIYPLSPMQSGLLFHTLYRKNVDAYILQSIFKISERVDTSLLRQAWERVLLENDTLRTGFQWEDLEEPLQYVLKEVNLPWHEEDWRGIPQEEQEEKLQSYIQEDRKSGFDLSIPPLMRISLIRCEDDAYYMIWTRHHIVVDGWCSPLILNRFVDIYGLLIGNKNIEKKDPLKYREYIKWIGKQDKEQAERFWRGELKGFNEASRIAMGGQGEQGTEHGDYRFELPKEDLEALKEFAQSNRVTLNTVIQAAWSIVLSRYTQREDVLFGVTVSGRSIEVPGIEEMVGLFINTLPLRIKVNESLSLQAFLQEIQQKAAQINQYSHVSLAPIKAWSEISSKKDLFDHILVFENYPVGSVEQGLFNRKIEHIAGGGARTDIPLVVDIMPHHSLELLYTYKKSVFKHQDIEKLCIDLCALLFNFQNSPDQVFLLTVKNK